MPKITIYSTPWCGYCKQAKEYFQTKGWEFTEKDVQADTVAREEMINKTGQLGVPVIDVNGKIIIGFDRPKIDQYAAS
ncbi:MAG: glutaredoxin domain-containing protein [Patescibacteria group bacterium]